MLEASVKVAVIVVEAVDDPVRVPEIATVVLPARFIKLLVSPTTEDIVGAGVVADAVRATDANARGNKREPANLINFIDFIFIIVLLK